jgi:hypothetical protein
VRRRSTTTNIGGGDGLTAHPAVVGPVRHLVAASEALNAAAREHAAVVAMSDLAQQRRGSQDP